jgi:AraC-like DNA-binding protein
VAEGVTQGRRKDLVGGGLLRSAGGWEELTRLRKSGERIKGDERILGGSDFVVQVLAHANEELSRRIRSRVFSLDFKGLMQETAMQFGISARLLSTPTKERAVSRARAALCHKAVRLHVMSMADVARALNLSPSMVSRAVRRAEKVGACETLVKS